MQKTTSDNSSQKTAQEIRSAIASLKKAIWERRPILGEIMRKHAEENLFEYTKDFLDVNPSALLDERKPQAIDVISSLIEERLGSSVAQGVEKQLQKYALVSTADHHGPIVSHFFVNSNIITGIPYASARDRDLKYLIDLSFATISLNNVSYPRGLLFHSGTQEDSLIRLPLFPDKMKTRTVFGTPAYTRSDIERITNDLEKKKQTGLVTPARANRVASLIAECVSPDEILSMKDYASQITVMNFRLWRSVFHAASGKKETRKTQPDLIYLEIESVVNELLTRYLLLDKACSVYSLLFKPSWTQAARTHFDGISGAFDASSEAGTFFFWGLDTSGRRQSMRLDGNLLSGQGIDSIQWSPEGLASALSEKKIFPSMLLCYLIISLYYGMKCLGGFCQVHDLTAIKRAWIALLRSQGNNEEAAAVEPVQTKELSGDGMILSYYKCQNGKQVPSTGVDLSISDDETGLEFFADSAKNVSLDDMMNPMLPDIYSVLYAADERDPSLLLGSGQIIEDTKLIERLKAVSLSRSNSPSLNWMTMPWNVIRSRS